MATFHIYINRELAAAAEGGLEFADQDGARDSAARAFGEILRDERVLVQSGAFSLGVADETGLAILELTAQARV